MKILPEHSTTFLTRGRYVREFANIVILTAMEKVKERSARITRTDQEWNGAVQIIAQCSNCDKNMTSHSLHADRRISELIGIMLNGGLDDDTRAELATLQADRRASLIRSIPMRRYIRNPAPG